MKKYFIKTFGCQANEADSEKLAAVLEAQGFKLAGKIEEADVVIINTCSVRESAENRVFGLVNNLSKLKIKNCKLEIILTGCMVGSGRGKRQRYSFQELRRRLPQVDEFELVEELIGKSRVLPKRGNKLQALVPIMEGCNHFCSYCVVPYARGEQKSRSFAEIVCEVEELAKRGYRQITLLGQNVNSYGQDLRPRKSFAQLLRRLNKIKPIQRVKFLTSNPWDLTDDIIQALKLAKIDCHLHLPVQSGDDGILKKMNRPYTALQYIKLVKEIRKEIHDIKISTDIIVGFPGETRKAFENTVKLCQKAGFDKAYIARYSPRPGTTAYKLKDSVSSEEKKRRWRILDTLVNKTGMNRLLVICGPTATGKTGLGIALAKRLDGEIISADSRQVYKGMDIATGKDLPKRARLKRDKKTGLSYYEFDGIPVWLLDVVSPNQEFSVAHFVDLAWRAIEDILRRGRLPIIVGGTGFYIKGVIDGIKTLGISPNWRLRKGLQSWPIDQLFDMLARLDSGKAALMNVSDRQNPRRLIRAIEVAIKRNEKPLEQKEIKKRYKFDTLFIGLKAPMKKLYKRIDARIEKQLKQGAKKEVETLLKKGYSWDLPAMTALGYREWRAFFEKGEKIEEVVKRWQYDEHAYARRQITWFSKDKRIRWFDITKRGVEKGVEKLVKKWYTGKS